MKQDPKTKMIHRKELLDLIEKRVQEYCLVPNKGIIQDSSVKHMARKISVQDGDKEEMINKYLEEVRRNLLVNINQYEKSDTLMRSEASDDVAEAQPVSEPNAEDVLERAEDFIRKLK